MVIFHSYVSLPEGTIYFQPDFKERICFQSLIFTETIATGGYSPIIRAVNPIPIVSNTPETMVS